MRLTKVAEKKKFLIRVRIQMYRNVIEIARAANVAPAFEMLGIIRSGIIRPAYPRITDPPYYHLSANLGDY